MKRFKYVLIATSLAAGLGLYVARTVAQDQDDADPPQGEVQGGGPVHEAFAQPDLGRPRACDFIPGRPPEPLPEEPPETQPEGECIQWIPGYWAWDPCGPRFVWVCGVYRDIPPGMQWVCGYWTECRPGGWRWICGFWAAVAVRETEYLPEPPECPAEEPAEACPGEDYFYCQGNYECVEGRYEWRKGCWMRHRPGMVYCAPRYTWTPRGCVFVKGYWDYCLERRGLLFAPMCFDKIRPGFVCRPRHVVSTEVLLSSCFVAERCGSYCFGDYYSARCEKLGYRPWCNLGARCRDPLFNYYRCHNRRDREWLPGLQRLCEDRRCGRAPCPPRTWRHQCEMLRNREYAKSCDRWQTLRPLDKVSGLRRASSEHMKGYREGARRMREHAENRHRQEREHSSKTASRPNHGNRPSPNSPLHKGEHAKKDSRHNPSRTDMAKHPGKAGYGGTAKSNTPKQNSERHKPGKTGTAKGDRHDPSSYNTAKNGSGKTGYGGTAKSNAPKHNPTKGTANKAGATKKDSQLARHNPSSSGMNKHTPNKAGQGGTAKSQSQKNHPTKGTANKAGASKKDSQTARHNPSTSGKGKQSSGKEGSAKGSSARHNSSHGASKQNSSPKASPKSQGNGRSQTGQAHGSGSRGQNAGSQGRTGSRSGHTQTAHNNSGGSHKNLHFP